MTPLQITAYVEQYLDLQAFYNQHCDDALTAMENGQDYEEQYYRDLQDDAYDDIIAIEREFEREGLDIEEYI